MQITAGYKEENKIIKIMSLINFKANYPLKQTEVLKLLNVA